MTTAEKHPCSGLVWKSQGAWGRHYACSNPGKVERDGKWWCGTHDPERVADREEKRRRREEAEQAVVRTRRELAKAREYGADIVEFGATDGTAVVTARTMIQLARANLRVAEQRLAEITP